MVVPINQAYVNMIGAFKTNCEELMTKFKEKNSEDFRDFVPVWKEFKFNLVYEKFSKQGLNYEFKEDTLQIAKFIMLNDHFVGGMFLLYGLYYVQEEPKPTIRLELNEFQKILETIRVERKTLLQTCQPGYLFAKLIKNDAFSFVKYSRDFSMEGQNRARLIHSSQPIMVPEDKRVNAEQWLDQFLGRIDFIDDLKSIEENYFKKKQSLKEEHPELNLALDMVPDDLISGLQKNVCQAGNLTQPEMSIGLKRASLKRRKMNITHRYDVPGTSRESLDDKGYVGSRGRRGARGMQKLYFRTVINNPESSENEEEESSDSDLDEPKLSLPNI